MEEKAVYLCERKYNQGEERDNAHKCNYWRGLLGEEIFETLRKKYRNFGHYLRGDDFESKVGDLNLVKWLRGQTAPGKECDIVELITDYQEKEDDAQADGNSIFFWQFYKNLVSYGGCLLQLKIQNKSILNRIISDFTGQLTIHLQDLCIRTLIVEMHDYDSRGKLIGENAKGKYDYFCEEILVQKDFILRVFERYPVLGRCIEEAIVNMADFYTDIVKWFQHDRQAIQEVFCQGKDVQGIQRIEGSSSDMHHKGRYVVKVMLDNGMEILCKPRSMDNEERYSEMLQWLERETQITQYEYAILSYPDHSWCSVVEYASCKSQKELENYYERLGVQLFLTYLLGTRDLHCENIIASGQYPVLIDLETLTNIRYNRKRVTANDEIYYQLSGSVLYTGILPFYHWNQNGRGVDSSIISGMEGQRYPFRIPVIVDGGTSDMRIEYRHSESAKNKNLATLNGEFQEPLRYGNSLKYGYRTAYNAVMQKKDEFRLILGKLKDAECRYLIADTQRYSMVLSGSYHPRLLRDGADRELFLYSMWKGRKEEEKEIVDSEVRALLEGDIPYFYYCMSSANLYDDRGRRVSGYFERMPIELLYQKLEELGEEDMEKQCEYIELGLMPERTGQFMNRIYGPKENNIFRKNAKRTEKSAMIKKNIVSLTERVLQYAVWNQEHSEVSWYAVQLSDDGRNSWEIRPMNLYLYNGLAGMLLLMQSLKKIDRRREIIEIYNALKRKIFWYTDSGCISLDNLQSGNTGAYAGESSILYTYLLLYQEEQDMLYLDYAKKHAKIVEQLIEEDTEYDLLNGNAGAVHVLLMLYELTGDRTYLDISERAMDVLKKTAEKQEQGIGWITEKGTPPMTGAAHGNSGVLMAIIHLWILTSKDRYEQLAEKVWIYEESLYRQEMNNWVDMRQEGDGTDTEGSMAWCHGAPGILYTRMQCYNLVKRLNGHNEMPGGCKYTDDLKWKIRFEKDMRRAYRKLKEYWRRDSWCLCHGICGNLWILKKASEILGDEQDEHYNYCSGETVHLLPQEKVNPGLMNGYGGILLYLIQIQDEGK